MRILTFFLLLYSSHLLAQNNVALRIDSLSKQGVLLVDGWKYQTGDNPDWAKPSFDDSGWASIDPTKEIALLPEIFDDKVKWLRFNFEITSELPKPLGLSVSQAGASEIYLNGQLIHEFGQFDTDPSKVKAYDPLRFAINLPADTLGRYTLAVRYALQPGIRYTNIFAQTQNCLFNASVLDLKPTLHAQRRFLTYKTGLDIFIIGVLFMLLILHLALLFYQKSNKIQLVLAIYMLGTLFTRSFKLIGQTQHSVEGRYITLNIANWLFGVVIVLCLTNVIYRMAKARLDIYYYGMVVYQLIYVVVSSFSYGSLLQTRMLLIGNIFSFVVLFRMVNVGLKKGIKGFYILGGSIFMAIFGLAFITVAVLFWNYGLSPVGYQTLKYGISPYLVDAVFTIGSVSIPLGLSLFVGIEIREINKALNKQFIENEALKNKAIQQEQEKQILLSNQNEMLEKQVDERTAELNKSLETLKATQNQLIQSEKLANLGELTAGISHEIQNPLNFVTNFSELSVELVNDLKVEIDRPEQDKEYIGELFDDLIQNQEKIRHHGKRASSIVKGMLEHSRTSTGVKELTDINRLADEYLRLSFHGLRAKDKSFNADYKTDFAENLPKVMAIPQDIGRVFLNLINNAFYAVSERRKTLQGLQDLVRFDEKGYSPTVTVTTQYIENHIVVKIIDNGTGMPESVKAKIFQPFFTTKPPGEGTGLGLSLSYDIVTKGHGGTMEVTSEEGIGTEFVIKLPC